MSKTWGEIREEALRKCGQLPPKTNADRIRAMSVEQMAELLTDVGVRTLRLHRLPVAEPVIEQAKEDWLSWLKQEADNGN